MMDHQTIGIDFQNVDFEQFLMLPSQDYVKHNMYMEMKTH